MTLAVETRVPALEDYFGLSDAELHARIAAARRALGARVIILGHHYQRDDVICHADFTGDSFKLAQLAASRPTAEFIVFCGVHFMAESADILKPGTQKVILPDLGAGCSMADMASAEQVEDAWEQLQEIGIVGEYRVMPITYMNSTAAIKAFCGRNGGVVCTSSNAVPLFAKALKEADKLFFFPDQHLGRNTGVKFGIPLAQMCVVEKSDLNGSTEFIIKTIKEAPTGSAWAVGTEINLVNRLIKQFPDKHIRLLAPDLCMCATMYRIAPQNLAWALESLLAGIVVNQITVPAEIARWARVALDRMLAIK
jgi:quinolinate synthase